MHCPSLGEFDKYHHSYWDYEMSQAVLASADFGRLTGRSIAEVDAALSGLSLPLLSYRELDSREAAQIAAEVETTVQDTLLRRSGEDDPSVWIRGWGEVAERLKGAPITIDSLQPQYFRGVPTCRLFGRYIRPLSPDFEYYAGLALRRIIFAEFLGDIPSIAEIGCGTGINLLLLAEQFPAARLVGADWAPVCREILAQMANQFRRPIRGEVFNMLTATGWDGRDIDRATACVTVHAMEQLGETWRPFGDFLLARRPALCLHIEPILELYDETSAFDAAARRYHLKRGYLRGFHPHVLSLCNEGKAELIASRRIAFGGLFHEAYSVLAWRLR